MIPLQFFGCKGFQIFGGQICGFRIHNKIYRIFYYFIDTYSINFTPTFEFYFRSLYTLSSRIYIIMSVFVRFPLKQVVILLRTRGRASGSLITIEFADMSIGSILITHYHSI